MGCTGVSPRVGTARRVREAAAQGKRDPRYGSKAWRALAKWVVARDMHRCWVNGCPVRATVADHIQPVHSGMQDALFYAPCNLRASCQGHNLARGIALKLEQDMAAGTAQPPRRYSYGRTA